MAVINTFGLAFPLLLACVARYGPGVAPQTMEARVEEVDVACRCLESATSSFGICSW